MADSILSKSMLLEPFCMRNAHRRGPVIFGLSALKVMLINYVKLENLYIM